jgi:mercuric ion transport protein
MDKQPALARQGAVKQPAAPSSDRLGGRLMGLAVVSTLLASACCVLPLVLVLIGVTGAWMSNLQALKPLTPVFVVVTLAALAWAGYLVLRPSNTCSTADGAACDTSRPIMRRIFFGCAAFAALVLLFPLAAPLFY